jgi:hypothetical protein
LRRFEVSTDPAGEKLSDLAMTRDRGALASEPIDVNVVASSFAEEYTAVGFGMADEIEPLHAAEMQAARG